MADQELIERFREIDKDGNGFLSNDEIREAFKNSGFCEEFIQGFVDTFDSDKDGKVSFEEYKARLQNIPANEEKYSYARRLFNDIDKDNSGKISAEELHKMIDNKQGERNLAELKDWIRARDKDGDGELNYEEFLDFIRFQK